MANPFKLEDHYDESFLLEDDDDDDDQNSNSLDSLEDGAAPTQNRRMTTGRPPSARHGSRSAHSTNSNRDAGYYGSYDNNNGPGSNSRPVSGKFKDPQPPAGPRREKSGTINLNPPGKSPRQAQQHQQQHQHFQRPHHNESSNENSENDLSENSGSDLESTDDDFNYGANEINQNLSNNHNNRHNNQNKSSRPRGPEPPQKRNPNKINSRAREQSNNNSPNLSETEDSDSLERGLEDEGNYRGGGTAGGGGGKPGRSGPGRPDLHGQHEPNDSETESEASSSNYNPHNFNSLPVDKEIKDLFKHITRFKPKKFALPTKLRPFIPEFIPAVGDIDAFLKIPRPDMQDAKFGLGWLRLDEPSLKQTDPAILDQYIKEHGSGKFEKSGAGANSFVHSITEAAKNPKRIDRWIEEISNLNKSKPSQTVHFTKPMPDIDSIMAAWPLKVETAMKSTSKSSSSSNFNLPTCEDLDCNLEQYSKIICRMFDIPVFSSEEGSKKSGKNEGKHELIQSLHVLFSTYSQFKQLDFHNNFKDQKTDPKLDENVLTFD